MNTSLPAKVFGFWKEWECVFLEDYGVCGNGCNYFSIYYGEGLVIDV